jgi:hypothetical protein
MPTDRQTVGALFQSIRQIIEDNRATKEALDRFAASVSGMTENSIISQIGGLKLELSKLSGRVDVVEKVTDRVTDGVWSLAMKIGGGGIIGGLLAAGAMKLMGH